MAERSTKKKRWSLAAYTVAVAAAVGGPAASESQAVEGIQRYCQTSWRNAGIAQQEWQDCTQQAVTDLIERISTDRLPTAIGDNESEERRELNRSVWRIIQRWRRSPRHTHFNEHITMDDETVSGSELSDEAWHEVIVAADGCLSDRQTKILGLLRDGWRVQEIADSLAISASRVSDEKYKAVQKLRTKLAVA